MVTYKLDIRPNLYLKLFKCSQLTTFKRLYLNGPSGKGLISQIYKILFSLPSHTHPKQHVKGGTHFRGTTPYQLANYGLRQLRVPSVLCI